MKLPASFLVVRVRLQERKVGLFFPVPLFVLEDAAEAVALLAAFGLRLSRRLGRSAAASSGGLGGPAHAAFDGRVEEWARAVRTAATLVRMLRWHGRLTVIDLRQGDGHVSVRLV